MIPILMIGLLFAQEVMISSLSRHEIKPITQETQTPELMILFQPQCHACRRQVQDLECLSREVQVMLLGTFASQVELRKEYRKFKSHFPGYQVQNHDVEKLGFLNGLTPQIMVRFKKFNKVLRGLHSCEDLNQEIKNLLNAQ